MYYIHRKCHVSDKYLSKIITNVSHETTKGLRIDKVKYLSDNGEKTVMRRIYKNGQNIKNVSKNYDEDNNLYLMVIDEPLKDLTRMFRHEKNRNNDEFIRTTHDYANNKHSKYIVEKELRGKTFIRRIMQKLGFIDKLHRAQYLLNNDKDGFMEKVMEARNGEIVFNNAKNIDLNILNNLKRDSL